MRTLSTLCVGMAVCLCVSPKLAVADENQTQRPNILWITSEDNAAHWMGCYGNHEALTPRIDALAKESILFENAFANAPVCAVARSTILTGCYAPTLGSQHMRSRYRIPSDVRRYVQYLQDQGYYCTNRAKTDFNIAGDDKKIWDECSGRAHYKNRATDQPFFAIFNITVSHESSLFPQRVAQNRKKNTIPQTPRLDPAKVAVPPYLPDLPEVRSDIAIYHDNLTALDKRVGALLASLEEAGLAEDTIVFYYSDHGGPTPRGKRYLHDTGVKVPLLVRVPEKFREMAPCDNGTRTDELVSFVDLAPTLLSLCGLKTPPHMQGRAFLGPHRIDPPSDDAVFLFADRFDEKAGMRRGLRNKQFKYIRRFTPQAPAAPYSQYSLGVPSWKAWQRAWEKGETTAEYSQMWETPQAVEMLFDTQLDPWEIHNLAGDPAYAEPLRSMRERLQQMMVTHRDSSVIPECLFADMVGEGTIWDFMNNESASQQQLVDFAWLATAPGKEQLPDLASALNSDNPAMRFWALRGYTILKEMAGHNIAGLRAATQDPIPAVRIAAAEALLAGSGPGTGIQTLRKEFQPPYDKSPGCQIQMLNLAQRVGFQNEIPLAWLQHVANDERSTKYVRAFANGILRNK